jgi:hypothetical protein
MTGTERGQGTGLKPESVNIDDDLPSKLQEEVSPSRSALPGVVFARLLIGVVVVICAECFSGASLPMGVWHPWTWLMTYWLYYAHFFFFTTLAVRTGRTSLGSLYLWGVLFGLYESWITKVIWYGYSGDGKFVMGGIGPYGFSEISMVFIFHPVVSFIVPLAVGCLLCPPLRRWFPDLCWLTGKSKGAWVVQVYFLISFAPVMAMNSGGSVNLAVNMALAVALLFLLSRLARPALSAPDERRIVVFGGWGFAGLCIYLALLYGVTYRFLKPEGLPSIPVQLLTFVFYGITVAGLWLHPRREPLSGTAVPVEDRQLKQVKVLFGFLLALAFGLSFLAGQPNLFFPIIPNFIIWTFLGFLLMGAALLNGVWERFVAAPVPCDPAPEIREDTAIQE